MDLPPAIKNALFDKVRREDISDIEEGAEIIEGGGGGGGGKRETRRIKKIR